MSYTVFEAQRLAAEREKTDRLRAMRLAAEAARGPVEPARKAASPTGAKRRLPGRYVDREYREPLQRHRPGRFDELIDRTGGENACHPWLSSITHGGTPMYGTAYDNDGSDELRSARRLLFRQVTGAELDKALVISCHCDTVGCMNSKHLQVGTRGSHKHVEFNTYAKGFLCTNS